MRRASRRPAGSFRSSRSVRAEPRTTRPGSALPPPKQSEKGARFASLLPFSATCAQELNAANRRWTTAGGEVLQRAQPAQHGVHDGVGCDLLLPALLHVPERGFTLGDDRHIARAER